MFNFTVLINATDSATFTLAVLNADDNDGIEQVVGFYSNSVMAIVTCADSDRSDWTRINHSFNK